MTLRVTRGGEPVTDLQPYLGASGHLVVIRRGSLDYLHAHPEDGPPRARGGVRGRVRRARRCTGCSSTSGTGAGSARRTSRSAPATRGRAVMSTEQIPDQTELLISGMTCASCANRIERKLNKLDGVTASVNYATEKAVVVGEVGRERLVEVVEAAGYGVVPPPAADRARRRAAGVRRGPPAAGRQRTAERAGDRDGDDPGAAVRPLAVGVADPGRAGRGVGRVAVPPGRVDQPEARHQHDGHPGLRRHARGVRLVALRTVPRHRRDARDDARLRPHAPADGRHRQHLSRGRGRRHHLPAGRALRREAGQAPCR